MSEGKVVPIQMDMHELEKKFDSAFTQNLGIDISSDFKYDINGFKDKIILLAKTDRYNKLIKALLASKEMIEFNSLVFEVFFAYDFESEGRSLEYEVNLLKNSNDTVDFLFTTKKGMRICFELHQANQRKRLTDSIKAQLNGRGMYEIMLGGQDEQDKIIRLQNLIISKCQDKNGIPRKFTKGTDIYNIIVVYISGEIDGHIDKFDCMLTMYGDPAVPFWAKRYMFGLCQQLPENTPDHVELYKKFNYFRETIHGVLFVKNDSHPNCYGDLILGLDLKYFPVGNNNLVDADKFRDICVELQGVLNGWTGTS